MAYDEKLAERVREALSDRKGLTEKKMFGGLAFMLRGHMCCGVLQDDLVVRVGPKRYEQALSQPHARPMNFTGRPLKGFVTVGPLGYKTDKALQKWVKQAVEFISLLQPKNS
jgi:TfoX/Sxy family transcriptional regulator of competence genes